MTQYYWFKAAPGLYYLFDRSRKFGEITGGYDYRKQVCKVWRGDDGRYRWTADIPDVEMASAGVFMRISPLKALAAVERLIAIANPEAAFTKENF